ncbi:MAG: LysR substrate-binding domain-containing protein [Noviherbaspirillum sp.]
MDFELADMKLFADIADTGSLSGAAARLDVSPAAISTRIRHMEDKLGLTLLYRSYKGVTFTPAGQVCLHHARRVLRELEHLRADLRSYGRGIKGHVRLLASATAISEFLPTVLAAYLGLRPDVALDLRECLSQDIVLAVSDGRGDIGIVAGDVRTEGLDTLPYREEKLVLATAPDHPLSRCKNVRLIDTLEYDHVSLAGAGAFQDWLSPAGALPALSAMVRIQVGNPEAACRMIAAGAGIGILPESAARRHAGTMGLRLIPLSDAWATRKLCICVRSLPLLPSCAREFIELLTEDAKRDSHV